MICRSGCTGFLWNGKQCAAYYGEHDGIREVVLGFDLRESDFALQPEFPVFMNHALHYLEDSSLLSQNVYDAGDTVQFHALNGVDVQQIAAPADQAGLFTVKAGGRKESYIVKFACSSQSDGRITAGDSGSRNTMQRQLVRKQMRNVILILVLLLANLGVDLLCPADALPWAVLSCGASGGACPFGAGCLWNFGAAFPRERHNRFSG